MKHSDTTYSNPAGEYPGQSALLIYWVFAATLLPNILLGITEGMPPVQSATNILLPGGIYLLLLSLTRRVGASVLWMLPLTFLAAFELVLLDIFGRSVIAVDMWLNLVTTNGSEVGELLGDLIPVLSLVVVLYLMPLIVAVTALARQWRLSSAMLRGGRRAAAVMLAAGAVTFALSMTTGKRPFRPSDDIFPLNSVVNCVMAFDRFEASRAYPATSAAYSHYAAATDSCATPLLTVVVIGETSRAANWSLAGYGRDTNPRLSRTEGVYFYDRAMSESNTTHKSVPMLLTPVDASTYADSLDRVSGLIAAFGEAGVATVFLSAQDHNHSYIDHIGSEADDCRFLADENIAKEEGRRDIALLDYLKKIVDSHDTASRLIVLHTYGSHFSYADRYPEQNARFVPDRPLDTGVKYRPVLINAYDNTIVQTDSILAEVIAALEQTGRPASLIYTSDHGENIYDDDREMFLHASPVPTFMQLHVPMLVWLSPAYARAYPDVAANLGIHRHDAVSSSRSLYHTALDLGHITTANYQPEASLASAGYSSPGRHYLTDHNEMVALTQWWRDREDLDLLDLLDSKP